MLITLENEALAVAVDTMGAELRRVFDRKRADEILWQGDPQYWSGSAPVLFPVVGRLKNCSYVYKGQHYPMDKHGFARTQEFTVSRQEPDVLVLELVDSEETLESYPFPFRLEVTFRLSGGTLEVGYRIGNPGEDTMYFTLGSHPGIALPQNAEPYRVQFSEAEELEVFRIHNEMLDLCGTPFMQEEREIILTPELFAEDALIFKNIRSREIRVCSADGKRVICVDTGGAPHLGIWTKPGAPYLCIEPWFSFDDPADVSGLLMEKPGILALAPGAEFNAGYSLCRE